MPGEAAADGGHAAVALAGPDGRDRDAESGSTESRDDDQPQAARQVHPVKGGFFFLARVRGLRAMKPVFRTRRRVCASDSALVERLGSRAAARDVPDPGGMPGLDGVDADRHSQYLRRLDLVCLTLVRGRSEVLEGDRRPDEARRPLRDAAEVEERPRDCLAAEHVAERSHMSPLDRSDDARHARSRP